MSFKKLPNAKSIKKYVGDYRKTKNGKHDVEVRQGILGTFRKHFSNKKYINVFIKVNLINAAFGTRIYDTNQIIDTIIKIKKIDSRLKNGDISLIKEIAKYQSKGKKRNNYSFATKYCHCHNPKDFPIYDNRVMNSLYYFSRSRKNGLKKYQKVKLREYEDFKNLNEEFRTKVKLERDNATIHILDRFLWLKYKPKRK